MNAITKLCSNGIIPVAAVLSFFTLLCTVTVTPAYAQDTLYRAEISGDHREEMSGFTTAISKDGLVLAIGSPLLDQPLKNIGRVRVYIREFDTSSWGTPISDIVLGTSANDQLGAAVAVAGNGEFVAIGIPGKDQNRGEVRVYQIIESNGLPQLSLLQTISGSSPGGDFGSAVALSHFGNRLAIGAEHARNENLRRGVVKMYERNSCSAAESPRWEVLGYPIEVSGASGIFSVDLSETGSHVAIGAWQSDPSDMDGDNQGAASVYELCGCDWRQVGEDIVGQLPEANAGYSVSLSGIGTRIAVGIPGFVNPQDTVGSRGKVKVYDWSGSNWEVVGSADGLIGNNQGDDFGKSVALSENGNRLVVGARLWDSTTTNIADNTGRTLVYDWSGSSWDEVLEIRGESSYVNSGRFIALSRNGKTIVIGEPRNRWGGTLHLTGRVRTYKLE